MSAWVIIWLEDDLWWFQEQAVCGRITKGGFATKQAAIKAAAKEFGDDVRITVNE